ncbi:MAG: hypothetical protein RSA15_05425 [Bacilli bacterium]
MKKKLVICLILMTLVGGVIYIMVNKNRINIKDQTLPVDGVKNVLLGPTKDGSNILRGHLFKNFNDYNEFMKNYEKQQVLKESDFTKNDYIIDFQTYSKCSDLKFKKLNKIKVVKSTITLTYDVFNKCGDCESSHVAYFIPVKKGLLKELLPIDNAYNNKNSEVICK